MLVATLLAMGFHHDQVLAQSSDGQAPASTTTVEEIVVTATRSAMDLRDVPLSVTAFTQDRLDAQGIRDFAGIAAASPGLVFTEGSLGSNSVSIRGIASGVGAATTALYINDTPIQVRNLGFTSSGYMPAIFDLERVEILKGPQGTLFGDSSEGGAVRFITPTPSLTDYSGSARAETSTTAQGAPSYELGYAMGGPIVEDALGFRASAYFRRDGGWVDRQPGTLQVVDPTGALGPEESLNFIPTGTGIPDANWTETTALRLALKWDVTSNISVLPSVMYEQRDRGDTNLYWSATSNRDISDFVQPQFIPSVDDEHVRLPGVPNAMGGSDEFILPSLTVQWDGDDLSFISTTSYLSREQDSTADYTALYTRLFAGRPVPLAGDFAYATYGNTQDVFTQEIRLQTADSDARLRWVAGLFYSDNEQFSIQWNRPNFVADLPAIGGAVPDGPPFGPGFSAFENYYGDSQWEDGTTWHARLLTRTEQVAAFGQLDFELTDALTITAGLRASETSIDFTSGYGGPNNNLNQPHGRACVPPTGAPGGEPCDPVGIGEFAPGEGPFAIAHAGGAGSAEDTPLTPKIGLSYRLDDSQLFYANIAKGYRNGGAQARVASTCREELISLGFIDGNSPESYDSDSVLSYELGFKNDLFDGRLRLDTSIYKIIWSDIQTNVGLSSCGLSFVTNGGEATSTGVDFQATAHFIDSLTFRLAVGYKDAVLSDPVSFHGNTLLSDGSTIPGSGPPFSAALNAEYTFITPGDFEGYFRADYMYNSAWGRSGVSDPETVSYDPLNPRTRETNLVNARVGIHLSNIEVALFADNLLNARPHLGLSRTRNRPVYTDFSFRPRTIGLQIAYRY